VNTTADQNQLPFHRALYLQPTPLEILGQAWCPQPSRSQGILGGAARNTQRTCRGQYCLIPPLSTCILTLSSNPANQDAFVVSK
jgi:hypothetical protein